MSFPRRFQSHRRRVSGGQCFTIWVAVSLAFASSANAQVEHPALQALLNQRRAWVVARVPLHTTHFTEGYAFSDVDGDNQRDLMVANCETISIWPHEALKRNSDAAAVQQRKRPGTECTWLPTVLPGGLVAVRTNDGQELFDRMGVMIQVIPGATPSIFVVDDLLDDIGDLWWEDESSSGIHWAHRAVPPAVGYTIVPFQRADVDVMGGQLLRLPASPDHVFVVDRRLPSLPSAPDAVDGGGWVVPKRIASIADDDDATSVPLPHVLRSPVPDSHPWSAPGEVAGVVGEYAFLGKAFGVEGDLRIRATAFPVRGGEVGPPIEHAATLPHAGEPHWDGLCRSQVEVLALDDFDDDGRADALILQRKRCFRVVNEKAYVAVRDGYARFRHDASTMLVNQKSALLKNRYAVALGPTPATFLVVSDVFPPPTSANPAPATPAPPFPLPGWAAVPSPDGERRECMELSMGAQDHHVHVRNGQLEVTTHTSHVPDPPAVRVIDGAVELVGTDRGKWTGGALIQRDAAGDRTLRSGNVSLLLSLHADRVVAMGGLRHRGFDTGHVWWVSRQGRRWEITDSTDLKHKPSAATRSGKSVFVFAGRELLSIGDDPASLEVVHRSPVELPYVNSLVQTKDGVFWVGLRHHVVRIDGAVQYWYSPRACRKLRLSDNRGRCECVSTTRGKP